MTVRHLLLLVALVLPLAACGGCEGRVNNSGSAGRCSMLTLPW